MAEPETNPSPSPSSTSSLAQRIVLVVLALVPIAVVGLMFFQTMSNSSGRMDQWREVTPEQFKAASTNVDTVALGRRVYTQYCLSCHGAEGVGGIGPSLNQAEWKSAAAYREAFDLVSNGVKRTQMIAWKRTLDPPSVHAVTSYIWAFRAGKTSTPSEPSGQP
ncbi:MAG: cytochrome c [Lentisphaeria bacterium]|jgi:mono/diheme cytochrome c family protein|nr:cytochrome c [Lentisphaeria bacterium]MDP7740059.1 cytochrome c [Lentisphaeria bacterium]